MQTRAAIEDIPKLIGGSDFADLYLELCKGPLSPPFHLGPNTPAGGIPPQPPTPPAGVAAPAIAPALAPGDPPCHRLGWMR
jgi:hypothetical protein